jgi:DNA polymerase
LGLNDSMTVEEKITLARALDLAGDYLRDGYARDRGEYVFTDDSRESAPVFENAAPQAAPLAAGGSGLAATPRTLLETLAEDIRCCTACPLHKTRERAVTGRGAGGPLVLILGDVPEKADEESGDPFAGVAGELLDRMLGAIALSRGTNCYLTNRIKCRPPQHPPAPEETAACAPFLKRELAILKPLSILSFERSPSPSPLPLEDGGFPGLPVFSTHHPALILAGGGLKRPAWETLKALSSTLSGLDRDYARALRAAGRR